MPHFGRQTHGRPFDSLRPALREAAWRWYGHLLERRGGPAGVPNHVKGALIGCIKSHLLHPRGTAWGRRMLAKLGGYRVQQKYREMKQQNPLWQHPALYAAKVSASRRRWRKQQRADAERRRKLGLGPKPRVRYLDLHL